MSPDLHHLSGAYAVDALDEAERSAFERHLAACAACRAEVAELTRAAGALGALAESTPPPRLRDDVLAGIRQVRPLPPPSDVPAAEEPVSTGTARVVPFVRRTSTWLAAAAAAVLLAVGGLVWQPWQGDAPTLTALEQVQQAPDAATVTAASGAVSASLDYSRGLGRSAITVEGLAPPPEGRTYQLWYIPASGEPRSAGFLDATGDRSTAVLEGAIGDAASVGVTVEPTGGSPAPTTDPVIVMALT